VAQLALSRSKDASSCLDVRTNLNKKTLVMATQTVDRSHVLCKSKQASGLAPHMFLLFEQTRAPRPSLHLAALLEPDTPDINCDKVFFFFFFSFFFFC
jgi:hypothetical protein